MRRPPIKCLLLCQRPLTQKRTPLHSLPCQKANTFLSEHTFLAWPAEPFRTRSQTHTHTRTPFPHFSTSTQCRPPSSAAWTAATSSCRTGGSRVLPRPSHPPATSPPQLGVQQPQRRGQAGRQRRRGKRCPYPILASGRGAPRHRRACPRPTRPRRPPPPRPRPRPAAQPVPRPRPRPPPRPPPRPRHRHPPSARPSRAPPPPAPPRPPAPRPRSRASRGGAPRSAGARS